MPKFEIWMEGFAATGQAEDATKLGNATGETFMDAVEDFIRLHPEWALEKRGSQVVNHVVRHETYFTHWGRRIFDNEEDARKSFG